MLLVRQIDGFPHALTIFDIEIEILLYHILRNSLIHSIPALSESEIEHYVLHKDIVPSGLCQTGINTFT